MTDSDELLECLKDAIKFAVTVNALCTRIEKIKLGDRVNGTTCQFAATAFALEWLMIDAVRKSGGDSRAMPNDRRLCRRGN